MRKKIESKQVNKEDTSLVRINTGLKDSLKEKAAAKKTTIKALVEGAVAEIEGI
ncbi:MAG: hypothetical protein PHE48_02905 [Candidatus Daviesbacteria bacterium]|nr:hypothetical protein [Candidatus Daviesbacteria bacterium]